MNSKYPFPTTTNIIVKCADLVIDPRITAQIPIDWDWLSKNPAAMSLLLANPDKIKWGWIYLNPAIFIADPAIVVEIAALRRE